MRKFCAAVGLSTVLASGLGGCASIEGISAEAPADAYASGKSHLSAGRLGLAVGDFQRALEEQGPSVDRLNALGATYDRLSRFDLADRAYRQALALDPNSPQTLNNIGYSYMLRGRPDLASAFLAKAQSVAKADPVIGANLALASEALSAPALEPAPTGPLSVREAAIEQPVPAPVQEAVRQPAAAPVEQARAAQPALPTQAAPLGQLAPEPAPAQAAGVLIAPPAARAVVTLARPQYGTRIQPVAKGVFQLVTIGEEEPEVAAAAAAPAMPEGASFEMPRVVEAMPAVVPVPVAAVEAEPLEELRQLAPAAGPVELRVAMQPMAGIIRASVDSSDTPFAAAPAQTDTASAVASGWAMLSGALVEVSNGSGIERSGARFRTYLRSQGVPVKRLTNDARFGHPETVLYYRDGFLAAAQAIASELPMPVALERNDGQRSDLRLRLGLDSKPFDNYLAAGIITASR